MPCVPENILESSMIINHNKYHQIKYEIIIIIN